LALFFGSDSFTYVRTSATPGLPAHEYTAITEIAQEAGASRISAGVHFSFSNLEALSVGASLGQHVWASQLGLAP
jgi:hypothetical protein